jgi:pyrroline-5-carboxylate reductase
MNIGFIGTGKISSALVKALCTVDPREILIQLSPRNKDVSEALAGKFENVTRLPGNQEVIDNSDLVFIALRPNVYKEELANLTFREDQTVISLIPFLKYQELADLVGPAKKLCRAIPLPTVVNHVCPIPVFKPNDTAIEVLGKIGQPLIIENENQLHTIWTLTGLITPFYDLMGELSRWSNENGVDKKVADKYIADMFNSLAYAASISDKPDFESLSHHAATPGGLNEKTGIEIRESGAHKEYCRSADGLLEIFSRKV